MCFLLSSSTFLTNSLTCVTVGACCCCCWWWWIALNDSSRKDIFTQDLFILATTSHLLPLLPTMCSHNSSEQLYEPSLSSEFPLVYTLGHYLSSVTVVEVAALQIFLLVVWRLQYIRSTGCTKGVHSRLFKRVITVQSTVPAADALFRRPSRCQQPILSALFHLLTLLLLSFPPSNWATAALVKAPSVNESLGQQWIEATTTITITTTTAIIVFYIYHLRQLQSLLQLQLFFALILSAVVG